VENGIRPRPVARVLRPALAAGPGVFAALPRV
jgi:hypothetical protein